MAQTDRLNQRSETGSPAAKSGWQAYFVLPETFMTGEKKGDFWILLQHGKI